MNQQKLNPLGVKREADGMTGTEALVYPNLYKEVNRQRRILKCYHGLYFGNRRDNSDGRKKTHSTELRITENPWKALSLSCN